MSPADASRAQSTAKRHMLYSMHSCEAIRLQTSYSPASTCSAPRAINAPKDPCIHVFGASYNMRATVGPLHHTLHQWSLSCGCVIPPHPTCDRAYTYNSPPFFRWQTARVRTVRATAKPPTAPFTRACRMIPLAIDGCHSLSPCLVPRAVNAPRVPVIRALNVSCSLRVHVALSSHPRPQWGLL